MAYVLVVSVVDGALPLADVIRELVDASPLGEHHASQAPKRPDRDSTVARTAVAGCRRCRWPAGRILMALCVLWELGSGMRVCSIWGYCSPS